jgi:hypothetical protein
MIIKNKIIIINYQNKINNIKYNYLVYIIYHSLINISTLKLYSHNKKLTPTTNHLINLSSLKSLIILFNYSLIIIYHYNIYKFILNKYPINHH